MGKNLLPLCFALLVAILFATIASAQQGQPTQYDLENFSLAVGAAAGAAVSVGFSGLKVGSSNPTLGATGSLHFEFSTGVELGAGMSILAVCPGYTTDARVLARITTIIRGHVDRQGAWVGAGTLLGAKVDSTLQPAGTGARLFIPIGFKIAAGATIRIEINNIKAPLVFDLLSAPCCSKLALLPITSLLFEDKDCCAGFEAFLVAGATAGVGLGLPSLGWFVVRCGVGHLWSRLCRDLPQFRS